MKQSNTETQVVKPIPVWFKELKPDFKKLLVTVAQTGVHAAKGQWYDLSTDAANAAASLGIEKAGPGELLYVLIFRALSHALLDLVKENEPDLELLDEKAATKLVDAIPFDPAENQFKVDESFFQHPEKLPLLGTVKPFFAEWLENRNIAGNRAKALADRLSSYFVYALNDEWRKAPAAYAPILESMSTPFKDAWKREEDWRIYNAWLQKQADESVFGEAFSLRQLYIPLRAYYGIKEKAEEQDKETGAAAEGKGDAEKSKEKPIAVDLADCLGQWLDKSGKDDALRMLSGGPGSGKSSFARMWAEQLSERPDLRVLYIPLQLFNVNKDLTEAVGDFLKLSELLRRNPLHPDEKVERLLLIFDGLDELAMQGRVGAETARQFMDEVRRTVEQRNYQQLRVQVLITGRQVIVQSIEDALRKDGQVLHLLPYYLTEEEQKEYQDPKHILQQDQRGTWWEKYIHEAGALAHDYQDILKNEALGEITAQPLLNYLVALSVRRGKLDFSKAINLNSIYQDLLEAVFDRQYDGHTHRTVEKLTIGQFREILEEIGLAAWHGGGSRVTTVEAIRRRCEESGITNFLETFEEGAKKGVTRLLTSFYFQQCGMDKAQDKTFEFTHKSFGEYLAGRRLVNGVQLMQEERERRKKRPGTGWDERMCLDAWRKWSGPAALDEDLLVFIRREVTLHKPEEVGGWQLMFADLITYMLAQGMPMEMIQPRPDYLEETRQARNAEEALLAVLGACARYTTQISKITWKSEMTFGNWLNRLRCGRESGGSLAEDCLTYLDLSEQNLSRQFLPFADLKGANLEGAYLRGADLEGANLEGANLEGANLEGANLEGANLQWANLERAYLRGADLEGTNLEGAKLYRAKLKGAKLKGANLEGATLEGANLEGANLEGAYLEGATLKGATLEGANLQDANLKGATLEGANLYGATLKGADLYGANLYGTTLKGAILYRAILQVANLGGADLEGANLQVANLYGTNLYGANVGWANLQGANLGWANLQGTNLQGANLEGANLEGAKLEGAIQEGANLQGVKGYKPVTETIA